MECIDEGIRSKKIIDPEALSSMIEQQVKKAIGHKGKEADVHMVDKAPKRPQGITSAYLALTAQPYWQQVWPTQAFP